MSDELKMATRRVYRYWYEDGIAELVTGGLFLLLGAFFWVQMQPFGPENGVIRALFSVFVVAGCVGLRPLIKVLKSWITYPRTGYVEYRQTAGPKRWVRMGLIVVTAIAVTTLASLSDLSVVWISLLVGLLIGGGFGYWAQRVDLGRLYGIGFCSVVLGGLAALCGWGESGANAVYFGGMGVVLLTTGGWTLRRYLQTTEPAGEDASW